MLGFLLLIHAETTERIELKLCTDKVLDQEKDIGYFDPT